jgi:hypothetical protein
VNCWAALLKATGSCARAVVRRVARSPENPRNCVVMGAPLTQPVTNLAGTVIAKIIGISPENSVATTTAYDPTCGSGSLL